MAGRLGARLQAPSGDGRFVSIPMLVGLVDIFRPGDQMLGKSRMVEPGSLDEPNKPCAAVLQESFCCVGSDSHQRGHERARHRDGAHRDDHEDGADGVEGQAGHEGLLLLHEFTGIGSAELWRGTYTEQVKFFAGENHETRFFV